MSSFGHRTLGTLLGAALLACGPAPTTHPPAAMGCVPPARAVVGTWGHGTGAMELRADGYVLRNSLEGTYRWTDPGRIQIDVGGAHDAYTIGLSSVVTMLLIDPDGHGEIWTRMSPAPPIPPVCYDLRGSLVGDWTDGLVEEHFGAAGDYTRGRDAGTWAMAETGAVAITLPTATRHEQVALATPSMLMIIPQVQGTDAARGAAELRPVGPRIETRISGP